MTIAPIRNNLYEEPNSFIGRERELDELCRFVRVMRASTLCGPGGIGKTRLAQRILAGLADDFPDGAWFVELGDVRHPDLVVSRVAAVVGVEEERGRPLLETLAEALRPRTMLLALDNCEHLIDACAALCQRLLASSAGLRVIVTSREPLRVAAEAVWQVPPLTLPPPGPVADPAELRNYESVRLFIDRAAAALPGFDLSPANAGAIMAICRALDGVPLAIELAAAWVRALSAEQIAERLNDRFQLLTSGDRTAPARQRTLRAAIDWSHDLLAASEQVLLRRLSVFSGWSLEMAEQVCADDGLPAVSVLDLIAGLVDKSLVVVEPETLGQTRYRLLDTIRDYAGQRLADADEAAVTQARLREYVLQVAEHNAAIGMALIPAPWSARVDVFRRYDVDADNALRVLDQCLAGGDAETGLRICTAIRPCWIVRGSYAEGAERFDGFLAIEPSLVPPGVRGAALVGRAQLALSSDPASAEPWARAGLELCRAAGGEVWTAVALNVLAEITLHTGRAAEAEALSGEAVSLARSAGDRWDEGYALGTRAAAVAQRGSLREAQELAEAAITVMREIDQQWGVARTQLGLGELARLRGDTDGARRRYLAALPVLRELDSRPEAARCLAGLGRIAMERGSAAQAREHLTESIGLSHGTGARIGVARGLEAFAALAILENRGDRGVQLIAAAAALREAAHLPPLPGARTDRYFAAARGIGEPAIAQLWARGFGMTSDAAVALALDGPDEAGTGFGHEGSAPNPNGPAAGAATAGPGTAGSATPGAATPPPASGCPAMGGPTMPGPATAAVTPPARLTPREREIVALIAGGCSNKAIADTLFISPATAARHVANILEKLGFTSRAQVAAWASGSGAGPEPGLR
jgi:predicted ATPase/DNA-binding CsgD family transcriptional regulator